MGTHPSMLNKDKDPDSQSLFLEIMKLLIAFWDPMPANGTLLSFQFCTQFGYLWLSSPELQKATIWKLCM